MPSILRIIRSAAVFIALAGLLFIIGPTSVDAALVASPDVPFLQPHMFRSNPPIGPQPFVIQSIIPGPGPVGQGEDDPTGTSDIPLPDDTVDRIVTRIRNVNSLCDRIPRIYRIDCLADQYDVISRSLPYGRGTGLLKRELFRASRELAKISQCETKYSGTGEDCFVDPTVRKIQPKVVIGGRTIESSRPLTPIKPRKLRAARKAANFILGETLTVLLRSTENSTRRRDQYARIVQAMDSNKFLLRS